MRLKPSDIRRGTPEHCCDNCRLYSEKGACWPMPGHGKCFRVGGTYYVDGKDVCPVWELDNNAPKRTADWTAINKGG